MNNPETPLPTPTPRPYVPRVVDPLDPLTEREEKFQPRYVEVPALREHGFGRRNLSWGVLTLILGIGLLVAAVYFSGQKAVLSMAACLFTFTALFVLSRLHIFRQRNGGFLAISVVVLLGAIVPLLDHGYEKLASHAQPASPAPASAAPPAEVEPPLLKQSFALTNPEAGQTQVRVLKDSRVLIGEKPFLIKVGDAFPLLEAKGGEVTFAVRDLHVSLPVTVVEILGGKSGKETRESAMTAALAAARPGVACGAVDLAARQVIEAAGFGPGYKYFTHRVGHGMGVDGHEWPYLVKDNPLTLEPGMTFSDEPGIYIPGEFGIRLEDDMVITEAGAELMTPQSRSLETPFG